MESRPIFVLGDFLLAMRCGRNIRERNSIALENNGYAAQGNYLVRSFPARRKHNVRIGGTGPYARYVYRATGIVQNGIKRKSEALVHSRLADGKGKVRICRCYRPANKKKIPADESNYHCRYTDNFTYHTELTLVNRRYD